MLSSNSWTQHILIHQYYPTVHFTLLTSILPTSYVISYCFIFKLDRAGPVNNRPSNNQLHHFVKKKKGNVTCDRCQVACDTWHMTVGMWHMTHDTWHVTCETWHLTCDMRWRVNILSKFQWTQLDSPIGWPLLSQGDPGFPRGHHCVTWESRGCLLWE